MVVQILVFEGDWSVYESTPPTPDHTPTNGGRTRTQDPRYENGVFRLDLETIGKWTA